MCMHGTYKTVYTINEKQVVVDACIADEVQILNDYGIITLSSCCGHGKAGEICEYENGFGRWKTYIDPPHVLIDCRSVNKSKKLGYIPIPYYYADGNHNEVWKIYLKTGCITLEDCEKWHNEHIKFGYIID